MGKGSAHRTAEAAWRRMFDFLMRTRPQRDAVLKRLGLTPNDSKALHSLDATAGRPMRVLAEEWGTDASNATWIVDRLERKGLAKRVASPDDRRVKLVVLTARGVRTRDAILEEFYEPPAELVVMDRADLEALLSLLEKVSPTARPS